MSEKKLWSREDTVKLISLYEINPHLWDTTRKDYKNKIKKNDTLETLAEQLNTTGVEIHRKLHNLKTQFGQEFKKENEQRSTDEVYKSKWKYFDILKFTLGNYTPRKRKGTMSESTESSDAIDSTDIGSSTTVGASKRPKLISTVVNNRKIKAENVLNSTDDEFQIFGNYVASELRNMHYLQNIGELKRVIQRYIITWTEKDENEYLQNLSTIAGPSHSQFWVENDE